MHTPTLTKPGSRFARLWLFLPLCTALLCSAQNSLNADQLAKLPGKHATDPEVQKILAMESIVIHQRMRGNEWNRSRAIDIRTNADNFITNVHVTVSQYRGTLPYAFKKNIKYKTAKRKLKKTADLSTAHNIAVPQENGVSLRLSFTSKGLLYDFDYFYTGPFPKLNLPDTDGDGTADYCDSCPSQPGPAYKFGCPLQFSQQPAFVNPDTAFNQGFVRVHNDFEFGFQHIIGTEIGEDENGNQLFAVTNGIPGFSNQVIVVRDSNPAHHSYSGTWFLPDSVDVLSAATRLENALLFGQMPTIILPNKYTPGYKHCGGCTRYLDRYSFSPYNIVQYGIYSKIYYNCAEKGKHCIKIFIGYMPEFY